MKRFLVITAGVLAVGAAGTAAWVLWPRHQTFYSDAAAIREPAESARLREILWQPPIPISGEINSHADEYEPRLSADGQSLYFVRGKPGANADIVVCRKQGDGWSPPESITAINSDDDDLGPEISPDGQTLYFYSDRPGGIGGYDLWMSRLGDSGWQAPTNLGTKVNSEFNDYGPAISPDGRTLCFASNRPRDESESPAPQGAWHATIREDPYRHDYDLYTSAITDAGMSSAKPLAALNSPGNEGAPSFSPAADFLYFSSDRAGGFGGFDIYRARYVHGAFEPPANIGGSVNTDANELDPALELGGYALDFSSDRPQATGQSAADQSRDYNLYRTVSKEVFREIETQHATIDWAGLWRQIGPNLMMALLALLLALLLLALLRDMKQRRLSLLARCLLTSLLIHLLLMLLFNVMEVSTSIASAFRKSDRIQISLAATAHADEIATQVRGELTDISTPDAIEISPERQELSVESTPVDAFAQMAVDALPQATEDAPIIEARPTDMTPSEQPLPDPIPPTSPVEPTEIALEAPAEATQISAKESPTEYLPRPDDLGEVRRAETPWPTSQPAPDREVVAVAPQTTSSSRRAADQRFEQSAKPTESTASRRTTDDIQSSEPTIPPMADITANTNLPAELARAPLNASTENAVSPISATPARDTNLQRPDTPVFVQPSSAVAMLSPQAAVHSAPDISSMIPRGSSSVRDAITSGLPISDAISATPVDAVPALPSIAEFAAPSDVSTPSTTVTESDPSIAAIETNIPRAAWSPSTESSSPSSTTTTIAPLASASAPRDDASLVTSAVPNADSSHEIDVALPVAESAPASESLGAMNLELGLPTEVAAPTTPARGAIGAIRGVVTDAQTALPLANVKIQLDLPGGAGVTALSGPDGVYNLVAPKVPDHFALTASAPGYLPNSVNVPARSMTGRTLTVDFPLQRLGEHVVAVEADPQVHHLGNDRFEGRINSQFQRQSEGARFRASFTIAPEQLAAQFDRATVEMLIKGVQCPHQIRINGRRIDQRLSNSPLDGSFGEFVAPFPPDILKPGRNTIVIRNVICRDDMDDFEFVNIQLRLVPADLGSNPAPHTPQKASSR